jgi:replicative DNA helicase
MTTHEQKIAGREPPHDLQAEAAIITSLIASPEGAASLVGTVTPDDFYSGIHRTTFEAIAFLVESGQPCDLVTLSSRLRDVGKLPAVGGAGGLHDLVHDVPTFGNPEAYAKKVRELAQLRRLLFAAQRVEAECYSPTDEPSAIVERAERSILAITETSGDDTTASLRDAGMAMCRTLQSERRGTTTGFAQLDDLTTGMHGGELFYCAARPGMGKTALGLEIGLRAAESGAGVLFVSLEMASEALMLRAVSARARVPLQDLRHRRTTAAQWSRLTHATSHLAELPFRIYDKPATLKDVYAQARRVASSLKRGKLGLVIVDHVGLVLPSNRAAHREQQVAEISRGLKNMANLLDVPVLALCQVGRDVAKGARRPQLQDLRESGSLEQDADAVIALHRPAYYDRDADEQMQRYAELLILKQRNGSLGIVRLDFDAEHVAFTESPE